MLDSLRCQAHVEELRPGCAAARDRLGGGKNLRAFGCFHANGFTYGGRFSSSKPCIDMGCMYLHIPNMCFCYRKNIESTQKQRSILRRLETGLACMVDIQTCDSFEVWCGVISFVFSRNSRHGFVDIESTRNCPTTPWGTKYLLATSCYVKE